jgi:hypothetical protein
MAVACKFFIFFDAGYERTGVVVAKTHADLFKYGANSRPYQFYHEPGGAKARPPI